MNLPGTMIRKIFAVVFLLSTSFACLITNCPRGGKRGESPLLSMPSLIKECSSCGPNDQGQCFGPHICCGATIGCYIKGPETYKCRKESLYSHPCVSGFAMCRDNTARCAANGICCSQESCHVDPSCRVGDEYLSERKISQEFSRLIADNDQLIN